ncbi:hypothetical protein [Mesorhizobium sp. WSM3626]|uniref:hypothetical protein n=1 Tax=Mesorhizobium sp. WSM3626 TaxID=1040987 RepID=UPI0012EBA9D4|nr:hypothetical protein [Mesorhizobium sp. WSM3626]
MATAEHPHIAVSFHTGIATLTINKPAWARRIRERKIDPDQAAYRCPRKRRGLGICIQKQFDMLGKGAATRRPLRYKAHQWLVCHLLKVETMAWSACRCRRRTRGHATAGASTQVQP